MTDSDLSLASIVATIEADGRWGAWQSDTKWWWASRTEALTPGETAAGCVPYVLAHTPKDLLERVQEQNRMSQGITDSQ